MSSESGQKYYIYRLYMQKYSTNQLTDLSRNHACAVVLSCLQPIPEAKLVIRGMVVFVKKTRNPHQKDFFKNSLRVGQTFNTNVRRRIYKINCILELVKTQACIYMHVRLLHYFV